MKTVNLKLLALAVGLAFSAAGSAQSMTKDDYQAGKDRIEADSKAAKAACASLFSNAWDVAVEKCDVYAGGAKTVCLDRAKARFGKS